MRAISFAIEKSLPPHGDLPRRITLAREAANLTMAQAARRLGVQTATWRRWERTEAAPRASRLLLMAGLLGVAPLWLLNGRGPAPTLSGRADGLLQELQKASQEAASAQRRLQGLLTRLERLNQNTRHAAAFA